MSTASKPILIAGPCLAESYGLLDEVLSFLQPQVEAWDFYFKASFDKANRSSGLSPRGVGMDVTLGWFQDLKAKYGCKILTDVHETYQVAPVAQVCEGLQIPAFLCRQTDLLYAAFQTGRFVNVKKGQFMAPLAMGQVLAKAKHMNTPIALTERGSSFGYGDLIVDMRSPVWMHGLNVPVLFDITHSTQQPPASAQGTVSGGLRGFAPVLARAAVATGYLSGIFMEVHPTPPKAHSDAASQLAFHQAKALLRQLEAMWTQAQEWRCIDSMFTENLL
jgi:2-dehydro-3-deoxyphosphooctonate aldolase (KDO 8-P synthase)